MRAREALLTSLTFSGMRGAMVHVKKMLEGQLHQCGGPGCSLTSRPTGEDLLYCSR